MVEARVAVSPTTVTAGQAIQVTASGFAGGEALTVSLTNSAGTATADADQTATATGGAAFLIQITATAPAGEWTVTIQGKQSGKQASARFTVTPAPTPTPVLAPDATSTPAPGQPGATSTPEGGSTPEPATNGTPTPTATPITDVSHMMPPQVEGAGQVSPQLLNSYFGAAAQRTGVPVEVLLAIAAVESGFTPNAVGPRIDWLAGTEDQHALGMMQFLPSSYRPYVPIVDQITGKNLGMRGVWDPESAVYAAAFYLRDHGAPRDMYRAIYAYNHADWYVRLILAWADYYAKGGVIGGVPSLSPAQLAGLSEPSAFQALSAPGANPTAPTSPAAPIQDEIESTPDRQFVRETGHVIAYGFLWQWRDGGAERHGYPLTEEFDDMCADHPCVAQYFERARFEYDPATGEVRLGLLGLEYLGRAFAPEAPVASTADRWHLAETGQTLAYGFLRYWLEHDGPRVLGYPISPEVRENGRTVQYFERGRLEFHPERPEDQRIVVSSLGWAAIERRGWYLMSGQSARRAPIGFGLALLSSAGLEMPRYPGYGEPRPLSR